MRADAPTSPRPAAALERLMDVIAAALVEDYLREVAGHDAVETDTRVEEYLAEIEAPDGSASDYVPHRKGPTTCT